MSAHNIFRGRREDAPSAYRVLPDHEIPRGSHPDRTDLRGVGPITKFSVDVVRIHLVPAEYRPVIKFPVEVVRIRLIYEEYTRSQNSPWKPSRYTCYTRSVSAHKILRGRREDTPGACRVPLDHEIPRGSRPDRTDLRGV